MSLNPYEVRLEVLKMAAGMLNDDYYGKRQVIDFDWNEEVNLHREHKSHPPRHPGYPSFPSEVQILEKANKLYKFISESK
jgi:hypothetical protein